MKRKFRILEKKFETHSEFHPQVLVDTDVTVQKTNLINRLLADKNVELPQIWSSLLLGTPNFEKGFTKMEDAERIIKVCKSLEFDEVFHEIK